MTTSMDQKAYLQKYLSGPSGDKKKKKKRNIKGKGFKIIDDDLDLSKLRPLDGDEIDILDGGEDAPQIAGIIDERPEELKKLEQFTVSSKWRVINHDDGFNSKLQIEEIKKGIKEKEKENELIFGKMYSDSEDEKRNDSDLSPPRKQTKHNKTLSTHSKKPQNNSDSDFSPPRKNNSRDSPKRPNKNYDSDLSPPRKHVPSKPKDQTKNRIRKPSRWSDAVNTTESKTKNKSSDSDASPPRRSKISPSRKSKRDSPKRRKSPDSVSPPKKSHKDSKQKKYDSDMSPPRKSRRDSPKRRNRSPVSDISPPRRKRQSSERQIRNDKYTERHNPNNKHNTNRHLEKSQRYRSSDSDLSPQRKNKYSMNKRPDSPPIKRSRKNSPEKSNKRKHDSDSDLSPPRKEKDRNVIEREKKSNRRNSDSPPPSNKKMAKTLDGKKAGLQDALQLRQENDAFRKREEEAFSKMTDEVSGRNAQVVSRKNKRETSEEKQKQKEKAERQKELDEKYKKWSKGLKQMEDQEARIQEFMHEASKPLARHRDDRDLEQTLKQVEREGDPMLRYIREKKRERGELGQEKPTYKGSFPPNRFNIRPGYRWDGVDRSNGYEKKYFDHQSKKKAQEEEAYKWSTEDL